MGYFSVNGHNCLLLDGQHQPSLVPDPSCCNGSVGQFDTIARDSILLIPPSSSSSELGNAVLEVRAPETQQVGGTSIALPCLPVSTQPAPKHKSSENAVGKTTIKTEYGTTASGRPFLLMMPLDHSPNLPPRNSSSLTLSLLRRKGSTVKHPPTLSGHHAAALQSSIDLNSLQISLPIICSHQNSLST